MTEQLINYFHKLTPCGEYQEYLSYDGKHFSKQKYRYYTTSNLYSTIEGLCVNGGFHLDKHTEKCVFLRRLKDNTLGMYLAPYTRNRNFISTTCKYCRMLKITFFYV